MSKTRERSKKFHWVGPIFKQKIGIYSLKSNNLSVKNMDELKESAFKGHIVGVQLASFEESLMKERININININNIWSSINRYSHYMMLMKKRYSFISSSDKALKYNFNELEISIDEVHLQFNYYNDCQYLALSKTVRSDVILKLKYAYQQTVKELALNELLDKENCNYLIDD